MNKNYDNLDLIKKTIGDTKYVLDDSKPCTGIKKVLSIWLLSFFGSNFVLFAFTYIAQYLNIWGTESYYQSYRMTNIVLISLTFTFYLVLTHKIPTTIKERDFLKSFMIYPLFLAFFNLMKSFFAYINIDFVILLYDTIPFELIITFIAIFQIYKYFNNRKFIYFNFLLIIYIIFFIYIKSNTFNMVEVDMVIINIQNVIDNLNLFSVIPCLLLGISTFLMKED